MKENAQLLGILIGGFGPAIFFGLSGILQKYSTQAGISMPFYLIFVGLGVVALGLFMQIVLPDATETSKVGLTSSFLLGIFWGMGNILVAIALVKFSVPISKLSPIYNINTLVVVLLGLFFFAEWKEVESTKLLLGTCLIIAGSLLVTSS
jgi:transporter family protein